MSNFKNTRSFEYFKELASKSFDWNGMPLFEGGQTEKGFLMNLKKEGLVETDVEDDGPASCIWVILTEKGREFCNENQIDWLKY